MPCYYPLTGYRSKKPNDNGRYPIVFNSKEGSSDQPQNLPCGQCIGCRLERSRQWAMRCVNEATQHEDNAFITLTYNNENLPKSTSLEPEEWTTFMKALRHKIAPIKIRFYMCGEYGEDQDVTSTETIGRPHFHAIIFGYSFPDRIVSEYSTTENLLYTSDILTSVWGKGFASIGEVTFESAAYVARYVMKKINGEDAEAHYQRTNTRTGEITNIRPEFTRCSMRPGIGRAWFEKYKTDMDKGYVTMRGIKMLPPKYYDKLYCSQDEYYEMLKNERTRLNHWHENPENSTERLQVKEKIKKIRTKTLKRKIK